MLTSAIKTTLTKRTYKIAFVVLVILLLALYVSIPVLTIPGNTLAFQLSLYAPIDYILFIFLSLTTSLLVLMQIFSFRSSHKYGMKAVGHGGMGILSGISAGILTSVTCVPCAIGFLGIFGSAGSAFVVNEYQSYFILIAIVLVLWGIYHASSRIMGYCKECNA